MTTKVVLEPYAMPPYDGLLGDSNLIRVIQQVIADPFTRYHPIDLERLTKGSHVTVRASLRNLTSFGLLIKDDSDRQHPVYVVNTESKRYLALAFLAYAVLDDKYGTDCMDNVVADYYDSELKIKYELLASIETEWKINDEFEVTRLDSTEAAAAMTVA